jgi:hypothetical protein
VAGVARLLEGVATGFDDQAAAQGDEDALPGVEGQGAALPAFGLADRGSNDSDDPGERGLRHPASTS